MIERRIRQLLAVPEMGILLATVVQTVIFWLIYPALMSSGSRAALLESLLGKGSAR